MKNPASRNRNLYTSDPYFSQSPTLEFTNPTAEQAFRKEAFRYSYSSTLWLGGYCMAALSIFSYSGASLALPILPIPLLAFLYFNQQNVGVLAARIFLDIIAIVFSMLIVNHGGFAEALGVFLTSFLSSIMIFRLFHSQAMDLFHTFCCLDSLSAFCIL
jgi:hypothetical protein